MEAKTAARKYDLFGTYLRRTNQAAQRRVPDSAAESVGPPRDPAAGILKHLADSGGSASVAELAVTIESDLLTTLDVLEQLQKREAVLLSEEGATAVLTSRGRALIGA